MTDPRTPAEQLAADAYTSSIIPVPRDEDMQPSAPAFLQPNIFPGPVKGPWRWPALEDARSRHAAALEAVDGAREAGDSEAERAALIEVCAAVVDGAHAIRMTGKSAENAYREAVRAFRNELPLDPDGIVPSTERKRYQDLVRGAREWADPDVRTLRRCTSLTEPEHFYDGRSVCRLVAQVEEWRAAEFGEAADLGEASFEPPQDDHDLAA